MTAGIGSPQWGSILEGLDAARLVEKVLEELVGNRLVASANPEVVLELRARRGRSGGACLEAMLSILLEDEGPVGLEPSVIAGLAERLERMGLEIAGFRSVEGGVLLVLRVEQSGDC